MSLEAKKKEQKSAGGITILIRLLFTDKKTISKLKSITRSPSA